MFVHFSEVLAFGYEKYLSISGAKDILGYTLKYREDPVILDPRNKNLGARLIINLEKLSTLHNQMAEANPAPPAPLSAELTAQIKAIAEEYFNDMKSNATAEE